MDGPARLYHNRGDGTFRRRRPRARASPGRRTASPACSGTTTTTAGSTSSSATTAATSPRSWPITSACRSAPTNHAHLYHNLGPDGFRDVSREAGLDAADARRCRSNAGDIDNDGYLDLHLGTGWMSLSGLVPDLMYVNVGGRFEDVTESTGTGHLQKGHGVSFADWDDDGDLDLFVVLGGGYPGDRGYNALFQNPGHGRHWLKVRLVGTRTNRSAIGARLRVDLKGADGTPARSTA